MRILATTLCFLAFGTSAGLNGQELGLREYLRRLDSAPGFTTEHKMEHLRSQGVTLSEWGLRELEMALRSPLRSRFDQAQTSPQDATSPQPFGGLSWFDSYTLKSRAWGGYGIENDPEPLERYTIRPRGLGAYRIESDLDPTETYTVKPRFGGGYRIESDLDPMKSFTVRPGLGGGYRVENDLDPMNTYTVRPRLGGGYRIENDLDPLDSYTVRPRVGGGYRIESDFPGRRR